MNLKKAIFVCIRKAPRKITRTVLQKLLYLATVKGLTRAPYEAHYYGPYSPEVASTLQDLASAGLIVESTKTLQAYGDRWEVRRYQYSLPRKVEESLEKLLTEEDQRDAKQLERIIDVCEQRNSLTPKALSVATKVLFVLRETNRPLVETEIVKEAGKLGWELTEEEIQNSVVGVLSDLNLVK